MEVKILKLLKYILFILSIYKLTIKKLDIQVKILKWGSNLWWIPGI